MVTRRGLSVVPPQTLMQAHELLTRMRPGRDASQETWLKYYRRSATVYAEIAEIDRGHHHEALYWANRERAKADSLQAEITKNPDPPGTPATKRSRPRGTVQTEP